MIIKTNSNYPFKSRYSSEHFCEADLEELNIINSQSQDLCCPQLFANLNFAVVTNCQFASFISMLTIQKKSRSQISGLFFLQQNQLMRTVWRCFIGWFLVLCSQVKTYFRYFAYSEEDALRLSMSLKLNKASQLIFNLAIDAKTVLGYRKSQITWSLKIRWDGYVFIL